MMKKATRAVSFHLNDPEELLNVIDKVTEYCRCTPNASPVIYQNASGKLTWAWTKYQVDARQNVTLGFVRFKKSDSFVTFIGPFFVDCEDEVRDVCERLGVKYVVKG